MSTSEALSSGVLELVLNAGPIAKVVLAILLLFSIISWALIVEKWWQLRRVRRQTLALGSRKRQLPQRSLFVFDDL